MGPRQYIRIEMSIIPNVSTIYRDLSHLSANSGFLGKHPAAGSFSLSPPQPTSSFQQLYTYKQQRHAQLMNRLNNSRQEHERLVGGGVGMSGGSAGYERATSAYQGYTAGIRTGQSGLRSGQSGGSRFVMPKIRYRHIEEAQQAVQVVQTVGKPQTSTSAVQVSKKQQLEREFYEDQQANSRPAKQEIKNESNIGTQTQKKEPLDLDIDNQVRSQVSNRTGNGFNKSGSNLKYSQNIQSYYQLCRKNLQLKDPAPKIEQAKFTRGPSTKNKAMKLDEAIKLLSLQ